MKWVPVISATGKPLMPCHAARARELVRRGRAVRRFRKLLDREDGATQPVACGIDPGSKWEGFTVKDAARTFLNIHADAITHVEDRLTARREMRRSRRFRKTPCRKPRFNRACVALPPSTKARWDWKLRLARFLATLYPISIFVVEDVKAKTRRGKRQWNKNFSVLEHGKTWFYAELCKTAPTILVSGHETKRLRDELGLRKTSCKSEETFWTHCVDSWVLAAYAVGGMAPDNTQIMRVAPLRFLRRVLHVRNPARGGVRKRRGGTMSLGFKRGTQVLHPRLGFCYVGGFMGNRISLHAMQDGRRLTRRARPEDLMKLTPCSWRVWMPGEKMKQGGKAAPTLTAQVEGLRAAATR